MRQEYHSNAVQSEELDIVQDRPDYASFKEHYQKEKTIRTSHINLNIIIFLSCPVEILLNETFAFPTGLTTVPSSYFGHLGDAKPEYVRRRSLER